MFDHDFAVCVVPEIDKLLNARRVILRHGWEGMLHFREDDGDVIQNANGAFVDGAVNPCGLGNPIESILIDEIDLDFRAIQRLSGTLGEIDVACGCDGLHSSRENDRFAEVIASLVHNVACRDGCADLDQLIVAQAGLRGGKPALNLQSGLDRSGCALERDQNRVAHLFEDGSSEPFGGSRLQSPVIVQQARQVVRRDAGRAGGEASDVGFHDGHRIQITHRDSDRRLRASRSLRPLHHPSRPFPGREDLGPSILPGGSQNST